MLHECWPPSLKCYMNVGLLHWNVTWKLTPCIEMLHECWPPSLKCYMNIDLLRWNVTWMLTIIEMLLECWPPSLKCYMNVDLFQWNVTWMLSSCIEMLHEYIWDLIHWGKLKYIKCMSFSYLCQLSPLLAISSYSHCLFKYKKIARYFNVTAHGCLVC